MVKGRDEDVNTTKSEMQKCECFDKKAASKGDSRNKSQKKQRQQCGTGRAQFTREAEVRGADCHGIYGK